MNILITGATGFIGMRLIAQLAENHTVYALTRRTPPTVHNVNWIEIDISRPGWTSGLDIQPDCIIHLAQSKEYHHFPEGAADMFAVNTQSTLELAEWGRINKIKRFLFAGTGSVYHMTGRPLKETDAVLASSMYAASKLSAEQILSQYSVFYDVAICRIFSVFGTGQRDMLLANIIQNVINGKEITLPSGTGPILSPINVLDVCDAFTALLTTPINSNPMIINLAGDGCFSLKELTELIGEATGNPPNFRVTESKAVSLSADNSILRTILPNLRPIESLATTAKEEAAWTPLS